MTTIPIPVRSPVDFDLPAELGGLYEMAHNLWWTWRPDAQRLFATIHRWAWLRYQCPVEVLLAVEKAEWRSLLEDETFMAEYAALDRSFRAYLDGASDSWFEQRFPDSPRSPVAYFSMEYGLHQSLPLYSGGLGVLSADHLKSASDLGVPFVAVGLAYRLGYFRQTIDADGVQQHTYLESDFVRLGLRPVAGPGGGDLIVHVPFPGREVAVKVWTLCVGRAPLLLLDTDSHLNDPADRSITNVLYTRGRDQRLAQEMVLGVGGVRALAVLGIEPAVWHLNEGHSALLQLERMRRRRVDLGLSFDGALREVAATTAFTTHTPVAAGHETFEPRLAEKYLKPWSELLGVEVDRLLGLGRNGHDTGAEAGAEGASSELNLTALGFRSSVFANGVSKLNAEVIDSSWRHLRPDLGRDQALVVPITNGVHLPTWLGIEVRAVLESALGSDWLTTLERDPVSAAEAIPDSDLWTAHQSQKDRLARFLRGRLRRQYARHGRSPERLRAVDDLFDPGILTVGFARRFATYKRASLLFSDLDRVRELLVDADRPVQVVLAGKAHPADRPGQDLIRQIFELSQDGALGGHVFFVENYDLEVGRMMVQGVDVWLNTPRKPLEASGTSGMKAAINGVLNCSVLDGWWPEAYDGSNGWAIAGGEHAEEADQDRADHESLLELLESEIVPLYYGRQQDGLSPEWIAKMKRSIATVAAPFSSDRMVRDYVELAYRPLSQSQSDVREPALEPAE